MKNPHHPDSIEWVLAQREILSKKKSVRRLFEYYYRLCLEAEERFGKLGSTGLRLEIGSGAGFFKSLSPDLITTDTKAVPGLSAVVDALQMPYADQSVSTLFALHVFHHLSDRARFFAELQRVLKPGGLLILIEPGHSLASRLLYPRLFKSETYEINTDPWRVDEKSGPMTAANQALAYLTFIKHQDDFLKRFPKLSLIHERPIKTGLSYLLSGGLNFPALAPDWLHRLVFRLEPQLIGAGTWSLHHLYVIQKNAHSS